MRMGYDATTKGLVESEIDMTFDLFAVRSVLFLPASNPRAIRIGSAMLSGISVNPLLSGAKSAHAGVAPLAW